MADMDWGDAPAETVHTAQDRVLWCEDCGRFVTVPGDRPRCPECGGIMTRCVCIRCFHDWIIRRETVPKVCPSCKSPYWMKLRRGDTKDSAGAAYMKRRDGA